MIEIWRNVLLYLQNFLSYGDILLDCPFIMAALAAGATDVQIICANLC